MNPSDAQARRGKGASRGCMQKERMLQQTGWQPRETALPVNGGKDEDADDVYGSTTIVEHVRIIPFSIRNQRQRYSMYRCVTNACFSIFSSLFQGCSLMFIADGRCALEPSVLVQSILKHRVVWACVSAQSALGPSSHLTLPVNKSRL